MSQNGTAFQFLWPEYSRWANFVIPVSLSFLDIFGLLFATRYIYAKKYAPYFYTSSFWILIILFCVLVLCLFLPYGLSIISSATVTMVALLYSLALGIRGSFLKIRSAYLYTFAWFLFLVGSIAYTSMTFGILPKNLFTTWALQIGSALQVVFLSFALADSINIMRKKLKTFSESLEEKVKERTGELQVAMKNLETANQNLVETRDEL